MGERIRKTLTRQEKEILSLSTSRGVVEENAPHEFTGDGGKDVYLSLDSLTSIPRKHFAVDIFTEPRAKERPRGTTNGNYYTPQETRKAEEQIGWLFKGKHPGIKPDAESVFGLRLLFRCSIGRGRPKDIDNMVKLVLDSLNGILWADDSQVQEIACKVIRSREHIPSTRIFAYTIEVPS